MINFLRRRSTRTVDAVDAVYAARVAYAAEQLDRLCPGWRRNVDARRLDMSDPHDCVLGQLYGDYVTGVTALRRRLPFDVSTRWLGTFDGDVPTRVWRDELRRVPNEPPRVPERLA